MTDDTVEIPVVHPDPTFAQELIGKLVDVAIESGIPTHNLPVDFEVVGSDGPEDGIFMFVSAQFLCGRLRISLMREITINSGQAELDFVDEGAAT